MQLLKGIMITNQYVWGRIYCQDACAVQIRAGFVEAWTMMSAKTSVFPCVFFPKGLQRKMEVPSDVQQLEPHPLGPLWSEANQQDDTVDRQEGDSDKAFTDELSEDVQPANQPADIKVSRRNPLLHICSCSLCGSAWVCQNICVDWWHPPWLWTYSVWNVLYFLVYAI